MLFVVLAVAVSGWRSTLFQRRRRTIASVLAALAAAGAALTTGQVAEAVSTMDSPWTIVAIGIVMVVVGAGAYVAWRSMPRLV